MTDYDYILTYCDDILTNYDGILTDYDDNLTDYDNILTDYDDILTLTQLSRMSFPILMYCTNLFTIIGLLGISFKFIFEFQ